MMPVGVPRRVEYVSRCWTRVWLLQMDSGRRAQTGSSPPTCNPVQRGSDMAGGHAHGLRVESQGPNEGRRPRDRASTNIIHVVWDRLDLRIVCQDMQSRGSASPDLRDRDKTCG